MLGSRHSCKPSFRGIVSIVCEGTLKSAAPNRRYPHLRRSSVLVGMALVGCALGGCASQVADMPLMGLPANTPARPATPAEYLPVHDVPAPRSEAVLDPAQRDRLEKDLIAARDRQLSGTRAAQRPK